jgi:hypothetical protein
VPKWSNEIPLWSDAKQVGPRSANSVVTPDETLKIKRPSVAKTSRGVNVLFGGPDVDGATAMYFSRQEPNPGNVANTVACPLQSIERTSSVQKGLTSKRSGEAATPVG